MSLCCIQSFNGFSLSTAAVPNLLGTREWFYGRHFFHKPGVGGYFQDDSGTLHVSCTLFLLLLHQLHLKSSSLRFRRLGTSGLQDTVPISEHDLVLAHLPLTTLALALSAPAYRIACFLYLWAFVYNFFHLTFCTPLLWPPRLNSETFLTQTLSLACITSFCFSVPLTLW